MMSVALTENDLRTRPRSYYTIGVTGSASFPAAGVQMTSGPTIIYRVHFTTNTKAVDLQLGNAIGSLGSDIVIKLKMDETVPDSGMVSWEPNGIRFDTGVWLDRDSSAGAGFTGAIYYHEE
jgi:hypothetical protein